MDGILAGTWESYIIKTLFWSSLCLYCPSNDQEGSIPLVAKWTAGIAHSFLPIPKLSMLSKEKNTSFQKSKKKKMCTYMFTESNLYRSHIHPQHRCQFLFDVSFCFQSYFCLFVMGLHYIALASLERTEILLPLSPKCLDLKFYLIFY